MSLSLCFKPFREKKKKKKNSTCLIVSVNSSFAKVLCSGVRPAVGLSHIATFILLSPGPQFFIFTEILESGLPL